jgi:hypothetical protein
VGGFETTCEELGAATRVHGLVERVLALEQLVHGAGRDLGERRHVVHLGGAEPVLREHALGRIEDDARDSSWRAWRIRALVDAGARLSRPRSVATGD